MTTVDVFAPAKINLTLHVTGQRADGYHLIDSVVAFAEIGDSLRLSDDGKGLFTLHGPESRALEGDGDNLVERVCAAFWPGGGVSCALHKHLPVASGIGGGSADAAACYRGLVELRSRREPQSFQHMTGMDAIGQLLQIGADVPMCVLCEPARVRGIGDVVEPLSGWPDLPVLLVNPRVGVSTPEVFKALTTKENPPPGSMPDDLSEERALIAWLAQQRNDLQPAALELAPVIADVLAALSATADCRLARMSGSGATCFGIFSTARQVHAAAEVIASRQPDWWIAPTTLRAGHQIAPRLVA